MTDIIIEFVELELGKLQTLHAFKMAGMVLPARDKFEEKKNINIRRYHQTLNEAVACMDWLERKHTGQKFRKEVGKWAKTLHKDGQQKLLSFRGYESDRAEGRAYMDVSKAIIDAFKKL